MKLGDKLRIGFNHNLIDKLSNVDEELISYSIDRGYVFNPDTIQKFILYETYWRKFKEQIINELQNKLENNEDISNIIKYTAPEIIVEVFKLKQDLLNKYYDYVEDSLYYFDKDFIVSNIDVDKLDCNDPEIFSRLINKPDKLLTAYLKIDRKMLVAGLKQNIALYYEHFNALDNDISLECSNEILKYAMENHIMPNAQTPKILLKNSDYAKMVLKDNPALINMFTDEIELDESVVDIATSIKDKKILLPIPINNIYDRYLTIKKEIYLNHHEIAKDLEQLSYLCQITTDEELYVFLLECNFEFNDNTPEFLFSNKYVLQKLLNQGIKISTDIKYIDLDVDIVYNLFLKNYSVEDINKTNLFYSNPKIIDWGLEHGLSLKDNMSKSTISNDYKIVGEYIVVTNPSVLSINKLVNLIKSSDEKYKIYINLNFSGLDENGKIYTYSNVEYLKVLKKENIDIYFSYEKYNTNVNDNNLDNIECKYDLDQVIKYESVLDSITNEVNSKNLSPFEKYIYVYDIVKSFNGYKDAGVGPRGRGIYTLFSGNSMVCAGYANLLSNLLARVGIGSKELGCKATEEHSRNYVYIKDDKYGIDGYYQCDATWDNGGELNYDNLLITAKYAYDVQLDSNNSYDDVVFKSKLSGHYAKDSIKTLDPVFYERIKNGIVTEFEIDQHIESKQNNEVDYHQIIEAIMNVKKTIYHDERLLKYIERELYRNFMFNHYATVEQRKELVIENSRFITERQSEVKDFSYEQALNSDYLEDIDYFIGGINERLKNYRIGYNKSEKCLAGYINENEIEKFKSLGCNITTNNNHYMFILPYTLVLSMNQQENVQEILSKLSKTTDLNSFSDLDDMDELKHK